MRLKLLLLFCLYTTFLSAQFDTLQLNWEHINGLPGRIGPITVHNGRWWMANGSVYYSDNQGMSWTRQPGLDDWLISQVNATDQGICAAGSRWVSESTTPHGSVLKSGVKETFFSADGENFELTHTLSQGYSYNPWAGAHTHIVPFGPYHVANSTYYMVNYLGGGSQYISTDGGASWDTLGPPITLNGQVARIGEDSLLMRRYDLSDSVSVGFTLYTNELQTATDLVVPYSFGYVERIQYRPEGLYFYQSDTIRRSSNWGQTWEMLPLTYDADTMEVRHVEILADHVFYTTNRSVYSTPLSDLSNWTLRYSAYVPPYWQNQAHYDTQLSLQEVEGVLFVSDLYGSARMEPQDSEFVPLPSGVSDYTYSSVRDFFVANDRYLARFGYNGNRLWFHSENQGDTWEVLDHPDFNSVHIAHLIDYAGISLLNSTMGLSTLDDDLNLVPLVLPPNYPTAGYTAKIEQGMLFLIHLDQEKLLASQDGINFFPRPFPPGAERLAAFEDKLHFFGEDQHYLSLDQGQTWIADGDLSIPSGTFYPSEDALFILNQNSPPMFPRRSFDHGQSWPGYPPGLSMIQFNASFPAGYDEASVVYADADYTIIRGAGRLLITADAGEHWSTIAGPFHNFTYGLFYSQYWHMQSYGGARNVFVGDGQLFVLTDRQGVFKTPLADLLAQVPNEPVPVANLTGRYFLDKNGNCEYDFGDVALHERTVQRGSEIVLSKSDGSFHVTLPLDSTLLPVAVQQLPYHEFACGTGTDSINLITPGTTDTVNFIYTVPPEVQDLAVSFIVEQPFRAGQSTLVKVRVANHGTTTSDPVTTTVTDELNTLLFIAASDGMANPDAGWDLATPSIDPYEYFDHWISFESPTTVFMDDPVHLRANAVYALDSFPDDNLENFHDQVIGSYDPNDKTCYPANAELLPLTANELTYRIRFQNTGNDTAFWVVVRDTLPEELDLRSFEMLEASHDYTLEIKDNRILVWTFADILLPDSLTNPVGSNGHIFFKIQTHDSLAHGTFVQNRVGIYFDYNPVVLTNQTENQIQRGLVEESTELEFCAGELWQGVPVWQSQNMSDTIIGQTTHDTLRIWQLTVHPNYELTDSLTLCSGETIEIFGQTINVAGEYSQTFTSSMQCDSVHHYIVSVNDSLHLETLVQPATNGQNNGAILTQNPGNLYLYEWNTGVTAPFIDDLAAGDYTLTLTDVSSGCQRVYMFVVENLTSIRQSVELQGISAQISPQPTERNYSATLNLQNSGSPQQIRVELLDVTGRTLWSQSHRINTQTELQLPERPIPGMYFVRLLGESGMLTLPWVVE